MSSASQKYEFKPEQWLSWLAVLLTWALVQFSLTMFRDMPVHESGLVDPDSYMRLVRVTQLMHGWHWFDSTIARANAPFGDTLHWTRPLDVLLLLLTLPFRVVFDPDRALYFAGLAISPIAQLATAMLLIWALRPVVRPQVWFVPAIALFLQPGALAYSIAGRADHHSLLLMVFMTVAGFMLRSLQDPQNFRSALYAGLATGFGMWISVEFLLVVGLCLICLGLPWLFGERERAAQSKWYALGISIVVLVALFVERPIAHVLHASYDKVSSVQYLLFVSVMLFWRTVETLEARNGRTSQFLGRAMVGVLGVSVVALLVGSVYPLFFHGPMAKVDPRIVPIWLDRVLEMRPLLPIDRRSFGSFFFYLGGGILLTLPFLKILIDERRSPRLFTYLFIAVACLLMSAAAISHMRFSGYAETAFALAFAVVLDRVLLWTSTMRSDLLRGAIRGSFVSVIMMGPILVGASLMIKNANATDAAGDPLNGCNVRDVAIYLDRDPRWSAEPQTILTFMDIGPELLYRTRDRVIGTPYHRNGDGIYDGYRALATSDISAAHAIVTRRGVNLVLLCQSPPERAFYAPAHGKENLYVRLNRGDPPDWLAPVQLPPSLQGHARLYRVLR